MNIDLSEAADSVQQMATGFVERLPYLVVALFVFVLFFAVATAVRASVRALALRSKRRYNLGLVLGRLSYGVINFVGLLIALVVAIPGFTPGQLISLLGLSSVAIGFAFRDILQNFLAGILLLLAEPFRIGDQIVINGFEGTVEDIQTRATFITTYDGRRVVIPNSNLFTNAVTVNTAHQKRRLEYDFGVGYGDDIARVKEVLLQTLREVPDVLSEPAPDALVVKLADSSVQVRLRWWVQPARQLDVLASQDVVLHKAALALAQAGIDLPFSTQQILFHDQTEDSDGDRARQREGWPLATGRHGANEAGSAPPHPARVVDALRELAAAARARRGVPPPDGARSG